MNPPTTGVRGMHGAHRIGRPGRVRRGFPMLMMALCILLPAHRGHAGTGVPAGIDFRGLVELPFILGTSRPGGPPGQIPPEEIRPLVIHEKADGRSAVMMVLRSSAEVRTHIILYEHAYEESSAAVFGRSPGWYRIGIRSARSTDYGWISSTHAGRFYAPESLLTGHPTYATRHWDRTWCRSPDRPGTTRHGFDAVSAIDRAAAHRIDVEVLAMQRIDGRLWLHIAVLNPGWCRPSDPVPVADGWVPFLGRRGRINVWFYPRGC